MQSYSLRKLLINKDAILTSRQFKISFRGLIFLSIFEYIEKRDDYFIGIRNLKSGVLGFKDFILFCVIPLLKI